MFKILLRSFPTPFFLTLELQNQGEKAQWLGCLAPSRGGGGFDVHTASPVGIHEQD